MRSKLILTGEGRAGKTSTLKSLLRLKVNADEKSTKGAETTMARLDKYGAVNFKVIEELQSNNLASNLARVCATESTTPKHLPMKVPEKEFFATEDEDTTAHSETAAASAMPSKASKQEPINKSPPDGESTPIPTMRQMIDECELPEDADVYKEHIFFSVWDLAGQDIFHNLLHLLISR